MADQNDDTTTSADGGLDPAASPQGAEPAAVEEELRAAEAGEDDDAGEQAAAEEETGDTGPGAAEPQDTEPPAAEARDTEPQDTEPEEPPVSRFGAQFSSPEPTAVIARPRRRATRPAGAADPGTYTSPPPAAPAIPAFVSFVAPTETDVPVPRRRSRRPLAESPVAEETDAEPAEDREETPAPRARRSRSRRRSGGEEIPAAEDTDTVPGAGEDQADGDRDDGDRDDDRVDEDETGTEDTDDTGAGGSRRRRRGRRGRGRGRTGEDATDGDDDSDEDTGDEQGAEDTDEDADADTGEDTTEDDEGEGGSSTRRRRRRRRRGTSGEGGEAAAESDDDRPERAGRNGRTTSEDDVKGVTGSTRLEAKRQRRRDGRDNGRRRAPILTESEFLARREAVDRKMVIRQRGERTQIAVLEDDVLVEHYVTQAQATSFAGNVYLGRVQNVLPSMEAAFVDIGKGRNAVLYAGEVNWDAAGLSGKQRSIEQAMKSGDKVLVQVTKDPIGHKGARLTQQVNLPGRFLVYVPGGSMTGISRKLPDTERTRLKDVLKKIVPEDAGVIIRTAAEGASEEELTRDVARLQAQWDVIQKKADSNSSAPTLLYGEPDLAIRVIRDVFNEDFKELVVQGDDAWDTVEAYVAHVSPELVGRLSRYTGEGDVFRDLRVDEQLAKALDRKVWLPSGGSLVIDRTEAMTVVDVNTGKFTGSGGNLEQTVTRNNMEAAEEIVRQLRLRDIGGMIVIDFIDMVLESNRDLVLRRLTECLGRDRTKHQVAEVTSLGLVQMTRKRVGQGLLEVFSEPCEHCRGRGVIVHVDPVDDKRRGGGGGASGGNGGNGRREQQRGDRGRDAGAKSAEDAPDVASVETVEETPAADGADADGQRSGGGRRSRGRRNRGQSGEERAAEDAAVLAGTRDGTDEDVAAEPAAEPDAVTPEPAPEPVAEAAPEETAAAVETPGAGPAGAPEPAAQQLGTPFAGAPQTTQPAPQPAPQADDEAVPAGAGPDDPGPMDAEPSDAGTPDAGTLDAAESGTVGEIQPPAGEIPPPAEEPQPPVGDGSGTAAPVTRPRRRRAASRPAGPPAS